MAELAARLIEEHGQTLVLCAASREHSTVLTGQCRQPLQWSPPDVCLRAVRPSALLLVEEAASLPFFVLDRLLQAYPRALLISTAEGYEGSAMSFQRHLHRRMRQPDPAPVLPTLETPLRYAADDPLEAWIDHCLLPPLPVLAQAASSHESDQLLWLQNDAAHAGNPFWLQAMSLLRHAHYRNEPDDLRLLLCAPGTRTAVLTRQGQVRAAAWVTRELPITEPTLAAAVHAGTRRPRGQLCRLSLIQHQGLTMADSGVIDRIVRIAVHPDCQHQGLGSALLRFVVGESTADLYAASFALQPALLRFWQQAGFTLLRVGQRPNRVSLQPSVLVGLAGSAQGQSWLESAALRCRSRLAHDLAVHLPALSAVETSALRNATAGPCHLPAADVQALLHRFATGALAFEAVDDLLAAHLPQHWPGRAPGRVVVKRLREQCRDWLARQ